MSDRLSEGRNASSDNLRGSLCMVVSMAAFAVNDALVKYATAEIAPAQIMLVRGLMAAILLFTIAAWRGHLLPVQVIVQPRLMVRTAADLLATIAYITALANMPLANASAIFQALPLVVTVGAAVFLQEQVGWRRWLAIGIGFVGVLVIVRPGTDGFTVYSLAVLASVAFAAVRDLVTRRMPIGIPTTFIAAVTALGTVACGAVLLPASGGWVALSFPVFASLVLATFAIALGYVFIVEAMRAGEMGFVAPFRYTVLVISFTLGIIVFDERPGIYEIVGSAIIVGSGLYAILRERSRGVVRVPRNEVH